MANYKPLGTNFDRTFRNDLNENFSALDGVVSGAVINVDKAVEDSATALTTANSAKTESAQAKTKADDVQTQLNNVIIESGTSDAEVIQARGTAPVLNERLNGIDSKLGSKKIFMHDFKKQGAETDDTARIQRAVNALTSGATLVFEPETTYDTTFISYLINIIGKDISLEGKNTKLKVSEHGISVSTANSFKMRGIVVERKTQAVWNSAWNGLWIMDVNNVRVEDNEIFGFTDSIGVSGLSKNIIIRDNIFHHCGQEPIAVRSSCDYVLVENNECYKHLGDGILIKGAVNITIRNNYLHTPVKETDPDYANWYDPEVPAADPYPPGAGGGITCNPEDGGIGSKNMTVDGNTLIGVQYGVGLVGVEITRVTNNYMKDMYYGNGVVIDNQPYREQYYASKNFIITGNHIENLTNTSVVFSGIRVNTGTVSVDDGYIAGNTVIPNGNHDGILASGNMQVVGNTIDQFRKGLRLYSGAKAIGNTIKNAHPNATGINSLDIYGDTIVMGNKVSSNAGAYISGNNNRLTDNVIHYTGTYWAVFFGTGVTNNTANNLITATNNQRIGGNDADFKTKNNIIDKISKGKIQTSGNGTATMISIPHGLGVTPYWAQVQPFSGDAGIAGIKYFSADATNINVYTNSPLPSGTNNVTFVWKAES